jgi:hypothetical protein
MPLTEIKASTFLVDRHRRSEPTTLPLSLARPRSPSCGLAASSVMSCSTVIVLGECATVSAASNVSAFAP